MYLEFGLSVVKLGEVARVPLAGWTLDMPERRTLRRTHRKLVRDGLTFEMIAPAQLAPLIPQLREISDDWLAAKSAAEKGFSLGFFDEGYLSRFPVAVLERGGRIEAFANDLAARSKDSQCAKRDERHQKP